MFQTQFSRTGNHVFHSDPNPPCQVLRASTDRRWPCDPHSPRTHVIAALCLSPPGPPTAFLLLDSKPANRTGLQSQSQRSCPLGILFSSSRNAQSLACLCNPLVMVMRLLDRGSWSHTFLQVSEGSLLFHLGFPPWTNLGFRYLGWGGSWTAKKPSVSPSFCSGWLSR